MKIILERQKLGQRYTEGRLRVLSTNFECDTLEPPFVPLHTRFDKNPKGSAIPYGNYEVRLTYSPKFHAKRPLICDVPFFEGIRIHEGNTVSDTTGCILVGRRDRPGYLSLSSCTLYQLIKLMQETQEPITLSVTANAI